MARMTSFLAAGAMIALAAHTDTGSAAKGRKRPDPVATPSLDAILEGRATEIWAEMVPVGEKPADSKLTDDQWAKAQHEKASDNLTILFTKLRTLRDASAPKAKARSTNADIIAASLDKPVSDLQAAYIQLPIDPEYKGTMTERVTIARLRTIYETPAHLMHEAARNFMKRNKLTFVERPKAEGAKGKAPVVLQSTVKPKDEEQKAA